MGELSPTLELVLSDQIYIAKRGLHPGLRNRLLRLAAFQNPKFYRAQAMRPSQENGYLVLRLLAQDVGRDLDRVLDTILRALARRPRVISEISHARN